MNKDKLYEVINRDGLNHKETIAASEEINQEVIKEMLKDPKTENIYLKQVIKAKDSAIEKLNRRIQELTELAQMRYEVGESANDSIKLVVSIATSEGTLV